MKTRYRSPEEHDNLPVRVAKATLVAVAIVGTAAILWTIRGVVLLGFAAVVLALLLLAATETAARYTRLPHRLALTLTVLLVTALAGLLAWAVWPELQTQMQDLVQRLPSAVDDVLRRLDARLPLSLSGDGGDGTQIGGLVRELFSATWSVVAGLSSLVLVVITAVYIAAWPGAYREGLIKLFPTGVQDRVRDALSKSGRALKLWLIGQAIAMAMVGLLVGLGAWLIGLPAPFALGVFAGLVEFIAIVGPILGAVPAVLLAAQQSGTMLLWTLALFLAIQQIESNIITPQIQERMVAIPPALYILSLTALGVLFGFVGVLVSAPMTVAVVVLVKELYVRQTLGEDTYIPGDKA